MLEQKLKYLQIENCSKIGTLIKAHGYKGHIIVKSDFDFMENTEEPIFIKIDEYLVPFFVINTEVKYPNDTTAIIKLKDVDNDEINNLLGKEIYFPTELIVEEDEELNDYQRLIGYKFVDNNLGLLGEITDFINIPSNPLFQFIYKEKEILVPINSLDIKNIDKNQKTIFTEIPDGLLDIYL